MDLSSENINLCIVCPFDQLDNLIMQHFRRQTLQISTMGVYFDTHDKPINDQL